MLNKLKTALKLAQTLMTVAQQLQKKYINVWRDLTEDYHVNEKVWLDLCNVNTNWSSKKLNAQHWKFKILKKIDSHAYCLNTFFKIHNVFHIWLLCLIVMNSLSSQCLSDLVLINIKIDDKKKFEVEDIVNKRKIDCNSNKKFQYKIKWTKYNETTWELIDFMKDIIILNWYKTWKAEWQCHWA